MPTACLAGAADQAGSQLYAHRFPLTLAFTLALACGSRTLAYAVHRLLPCPKRTGCFANASSSAAGHGQAGPGLELSADCFPVGTSPAPERTYECSGLLSLRCRWTSGNETESSAALHHAPLAAQLLVPCLLAATLLATLL